MKNLFIFIYFCILTFFLSIFSYSIDLLLLFYYIHILKLCIPPRVFLYKNKNCSISTLVQQSLYFQIWKMISNYIEVNELYFELDLVGVRKKIDGN